MATTLIREIADGIYQCVYCLSEGYTYAQASQRCTCSDDTDPLEGCHVDSEEMEIE